MPEITINLTDEENAFIESSMKTGRGRHMLRRNGYRGEMKEVMTVEEYVTAIVKSVSGEQERERGKIRQEMIEARAKEKVKVK